jgi:hypothetical protein
LHRWDKTNAECHQSFANGTLNAGFRSGFWKPLSRIAGQIRQDRQTAQATNLSELHVCSVRRGFAALGYLGDLVVGRSILQSVANRESGPKVLLGHGFIRVSTKSSRPQLFIFTGLNTVEAMKGMNQFVSEHYKRSCTFTF